MWWWDLVEQCCLGRFLVQRRRMLTAAYLRRLLLTSASPPQPPGQRTHYSRLNRTRWLIPSRHRTRDCPREGLCVGALLPGIELPSSKIGSYSGYIHLAASTKSTYDRRLSWNNFDPHCTAPELIHVLSRF